MRMVSCSERLLWTVLSRAFFFFLRSYSVPRNQLSVLLPNPNMRLSVGTRVLAMYPDTTTFYPATVAENAASRRDHMYLLNFDDEEDDTDAGGAGGVTLAKTVAPKYVAAGVL